MPVQILKSTRSPCDRLGFWKAGSGAVVRVMAYSQLENISHALGGKRRGNGSLLRKREIRARLQTKKPVGAV